MNDIEAENVIENLREKNFHLSMAVKIKRAYKVIIFTLGT